MGIEHDSNCLLLLQFVRRIDCCMYLFYWNGIGVGWGGEGWLWGGGGGGGSGGGGRVRCLVCVLMGWGFENNLKGCFDAVG